MHTPKEHRQLQVDAVARILAIAAVLVPCLALAGHDPAVPKEDHAARSALNKVPAARSALRPIVATFSVAAYDPATGEVGVAVQSKFFGVGVVVPWCRAGVGAVATQAYANTTYGVRGLELMAEGTSPDAAILELLKDDEDRAHRQVGMVMVREATPGVTLKTAADTNAHHLTSMLPLGVAGSLAGVAATYTGEDCLDWAGGHAGVTADGIVYAAQGNILAGPGVVEAMAAAMEEADSVELGELTDEEARALETPDLAGRMLAALIAGQAAGGDSRGMQSAALKVAQEGAGYGGFTDVKYDLRVDDAEDPFHELARLLNLARPVSLAFEGYNKLYAGDFAAATSIFSKLVELEPESAGHHYNLACALSLSGSLDDAMEQPKIALELDPQMLPHARGDSDLDPLRTREDFMSLLGEESASEE